MTNKEYLANKLQENGWQLGCYTLQAEKLGKRTLNRIIEAWLMNEATDLIFTMNGVKYVASLDTVDNEKDINIMTLSSYQETFGSF